MTIFSRAIPFLILFLSLISSAEDIQRFPPPDFESGYVMPSTPVPPPRAELLVYLDVVVLLAALSVSSYLAIKKRRRRDIFILMIFSLLYFGFYRKGCICSIGAIQNISLAFFDTTYTMPVAAMAFFLLPLVFALFFGRVFCAGVCPMGAIQDLVLIKPIKIPGWLQQALGLLPFLYLGSAVLFAALGSAFIICEYDPFVSFFRFSGRFSIIALGILLLGISTIVGRPYCLFLCPYSVLLRLLSSLSKWQVSIPPETCLQCRICEESCPYGVIIPPTPKETASPAGTDRVRFVILILLAPVIIAGSGWIFSKAGATFSRMHYTVRLAEQIVLEDSGKVKEISDAGKAFRDTGQPKEILFQEAQRLRERFSSGCWFLGGFFGLVIALKLIRLSIFRRRNDFEIDPAGCVACGRCFSDCPAEIKRQKNLASTAQCELKLTEK